MSTRAGKDILTANPNHQGSLGTAISEAVELARMTPGCKYTLGSVMNHVSLHQTIVGLESEKQMEMAGEYPDFIVACFGGGSNFSGISFPFIRHILDGTRKGTRFIAAEPASCPKITQGKFDYDFGDEAGYTPLIPMYTLGHKFQPANIHAGGLRYHGAGMIVSQLLKDGYMEAADVKQLDSFAAGVLTMSAFTDQLLRENPGLQVYKQSSNADMGYLNPFSLYNPDVQPTDEGYNNKYAYWQKEYHRMCDSLQRPEVVFGPLLTDLSLLDEIQDGIHLEKALFAVASGLQCNGSISDNLWEFFPHEERCRMFECYNFRFFASKGADTLFQKGRQWAFVWRTMQDIIDKADSDIASGEYAARLRFGHDIIVMSLMVLMDIDGYNIPAGSPEQVKDVFRSYDFPMSLNVQFVFYRNATGNVLVRMMYNERDLALPLADCGTPYYYRWEDLRSFLLQRIGVAQGIIASTQAPPKTKN